MKPFFSSSINCWRISPALFGTLFATLVFKTSAQEAAKPADEPLILSEYVVTGTAQPVRKFDSAFSVSSFTEAKIERLAPLNAVDLVKSMPGFWAEPSGGEVGNNIAVRGLPSSNFRFVGFFEDGLPNFQEQQANNLNADEIMRIDATIEGVESVRGGTAAIFSSNSPGANINFITKKGSETREGLARLTISDFGERRWDGVLSGPITNGLTGSVGGFYRTDDGIRNPGFTADQGGQLRASLTQKFENGSVTGYVRVLNDRNMFQLPIPLADPRNPSVSLSNLIDPHTGTLTSSDFQHVRYRTLDGTSGGSTIDADLSDGVHSKVTSVGVIADINLGDGWKLVNHFRNESGKVDFTAMYSTTAPVDAAAYLSQQLTRAQATWSSAVSARYVLANSRGAGNSRIAFNPATTDGLVMNGGFWQFPTSYDNTLDDLRLNKKFETALGSHQLTVGFYMSDYSTSQRVYNNTMLMEVHSKPRALDIEALDASGNVVGSVTENGFVQYGTTNVLGGYGEGRMLAPYFAETWNINQALSVDVGFRYQRQVDSGYALLATTQNLGNASTLADDNVQGPSGLVQNRNGTYKAQNMTFGVNYKFTSTLAAFARYTTSGRTPSLMNIYLQQTTPVVKIKDAEVGVKYSTRKFSAFWTFFDNRFDPLLENLLLPNAAGNFVNTPFSAKTETYGTEFEGTWAPISAFELSGNFTAQNPKYVEFLDPVTGAQIANTTEKSVRRIPKFLVNIQPRFFFNAWGQRQEVYASYYYAGKRFVDSANLTALPSYSTFDAGITLHFNERLSLQFIGSNLTNSAGLTEGNSRVDALAGQGTPVAIYGRPIEGRSFRSVMTYRF